MELSVIFVEIYSTWNKQEKKSNLSKPIQLFVGMFQILYNWEICTVEHVKRTYFGLKEKTLGLNSFQQAVAYTHMTVST